MRQFRLDLDPIELLRYWLALTRGSSSAFRRTAGAAGFFTLSQWSDRPAVYREPHRLLAIHCSRADVRARKRPGRFAPAGRVLRYLPMILISTRLRRPPSNSP